MTHNRLNSTAPQVIEKTNIDTILRAVASSSAIESKLSVEAVELKLRKNSSRFAHLKLAL